MAALCTGALTGAWVGTGQYAFAANATAQSAEGTKDVSVSVTSPAPSATPSTAETSASNSTQASASNSEKQTTANESTAAQPAKSTENASPASNTTNDAKTSNDSSAEAQPSTEAKATEATSQDTTAPASSSTVQEQAKAAVQGSENGVLQSAENPALKAWQEARPAEEMLNKESQAAVGKKVVAIEIEGADGIAKTTAQAAITMRVGDVYDAKRLDDDRNAIFDTGYFYDLYPTWREVPEGVVITYHVLENPVLKSITLDGNTVESTAKLKHLLTLQTGEILNSRTLQKDVTAIQEEYRKDGYILAKIQDMHIDKDGNLTITISEGVLEGFSVKGNQKTKDRVILREMRQKPGEVFDVKKARRSMQRVYNLGFFEDVNMKLVPGKNPGGVILEIDVVEKRTGTFGIGAGYSSEDGFVGMISIGDSNFRGTGDAINLLYEFSGDENDAHGYVFSYRRPWLDKKETVGTLRIYDRRYEYDDYNTEGNLTETYMRKYTGGEVTFGRPASEYSTNYVTLRNRKESYIRHVSGRYDRQTPEYEQWRDDNFGLTRSVILQHVTDTRDNIYNPTTGGRVSLEGEFAGLGGDFHYQKYTIEDSRFFKVGHAQVVALRGQYGISGNGHIPEFGQYRIGGQDSLRGYREDQFRGTRMYLFTTEYRFPLVSKIQGAIFTDWGAAWNDGYTPGSGDSHGSIGVGMQIDTPIGAIRLDYGHGEDGGRVHFNVGGSF